MRRSLAFTLLFVATFGADAAPQAQAKKPKASKVVQMVTVSGECSKLIQAGVTVEGCKPVLLNLNYPTGVSAYWFATEHAILSFSGDGSRRVEQGPHIVVQSIERVITAATTTGSKAEDAKEETAIGFCRFGDPTIKGSMLECVAHTQAGRYEGTFVPDGNPPQLEAFQVDP
jgi:LytS/YehU family sensor histidine kinase